MFFSCRMNFRLTSVAVALLLAASVAQAAAVVDTHGGGGVRVDIADGPQAGNRVDKPALYRGAFDAQWAALAAPFCSALVDQINAAGPRADGTYVRASRCVPSAGAGSLELVYDDAVPTKSVGLTSLEYADVSGIVGAWPNRAMPAPAAQGCFSSRIAVTVTALLNPAALTFQSVTWNANGGFPQNTCTNALNRFPNGDVSTGLQPYFNGRDFLAAAQAARSKAGLDPVAPLKAARDAYGPTVTGLRARFPLMTVSVRSGVIHYDFGSVSSTTCCGPIREPVRAPATPNPNAIH